MDQPRILRFAEYELFDLGKLVNPEQAFGVKAVGTDLTPEARGDACKPQSERRTATLMEPEDLSLA